MVFRYLNTLQKASCVTIPRIADILELSNILLHLSEGKSQAEF